MDCLLVLFVVLTTAVAAPWYEEARLALQNPDLYDGDIEGIDGPFDPERNAIVATQFRWPDAKVPYVIDTSLEHVTNLIEDAMKHYHEKTCVKFVPRSDEKDYVKLYAGKTCSSKIGRVGGEQLLSLGKPCEYLGTVIHELGHALGFYHEHSRSDRDDHVKVYIENVLPGKEYNFEKLPPTQNILYNDFDYFSIMIYGNTAFSKNGEDTMKATTGFYIMQDPYWKRSMTKSDISRVNRMYECKGH